MTQIVTDAIVLHAFDYLESSRILRVVTREAGVRSVLARGARKSSKRFGAALDLYAQGIADLQTKPGRDLDTARVNLVQAQGQFNEASKHLESAKAVTREQALKNAEGQLKSAQGKLRQAQASVSYTEIRSPIDGVVTERPYFAGEIAQAGTPLITVMDTSSLMAKAHFPQEEAQQLKIGADAEVTISGMEKPVSGKVTLVSPALDTGSTTVEVWVKVPNKDGVLKPGTAARVAIAAETVKSAIVVPQTALLKDESGKTSVMVVDRGAAKKREVSVGISDGENVQIVSGVKAGEQVITVGAYGLDDGTKVKIGAAEDEPKPDAKKSEDKD